MVQFHYYNLKILFNKIDENYLDYINTYNEVLHYMKYTIFYENLSGYYNNQPIIKLGDTDFINIFNVMYDKPPSFVLNQEYMTNLMIDLNQILKTSDETKYRDGSLYNNILIFLKLIAGTEIKTVDRDYIINRDTVGSSFIDSKDKAILRNLIYTAIQQLSDDKLNLLQMLRISENKLNLIQGLRQIQQSLQGIYLGYGYSKGKILNNIEEDIYIQGKNNCLIFGDIHGDIMPILEVFKTKGINFNNLYTYDIIFLGDVYDPFNNEFIIRSTTYDGNAKEFNNKLSNFANDDMYLTIIFVLYLAYKGAKVFWILGNHDINSCALNPFFYAMMNLLVNDVDGVSNLRSDTGEFSDGLIISKGLIRQIQSNLFICQKLFYKYGDKKFLFYHNPSKIYDKKDESNQCMLLNPNSIINNLSIPYYQPTTDIVNKSDICATLRQETYLYASSTSQTEITKTQLFRDIKKQFRPEFMVYGHTYEFNETSFQMFNGNPMQFFSTVEFNNIRSISLDHTTSFYKSTSRACNILNVMLPPYETLGTFNSKRNLASFIKRFFQNEFKFYKQVGGRLLDVYNIDSDNSLDYIIKRDINNEIVKIADVYYLVSYIKNKIDDFIGKNIAVTNNIIKQSIIDDVKYNGYKPTIEHTIGRLIQHGYIDTNISFCRYVYVNFDNVEFYINIIIQNLILLGYYDVDNKVEKLMSIYRLFNNLNRFISSNDKTTYDSYRNEIFMVNKHKLINGIPLNEEDLCGHIYYIHGLGLNINLESIDLKSCYINKLNCVNNYRNNFLTGGKSDPTIKTSEFHGIESIQPNLSSIDMLKLHKTKDEVVKTDSIIEQSSFINENTNIDIIDLFGYLDKNPFIEKKLCEKFYYEIIYHSINDEPLKSLYKKYITDYLYMYVYDVNHLSKYEFMKLDKKNFNTKKYLEKILKLYDFLNINLSKHEDKKIPSAFHKLVPDKSLKDQIIRSEIKLRDDSNRREIGKINNLKLTINSIGIKGDGLPDFDIKKAIKFIYYHSLERAWETEYFIINRNNISEDKYEIEINKEYEKYIVVLDFAFEFIQSLGLSEQLKIFIFNSIKTFKTIQEINMIIVYIQYYLHQNEIFVDKQFALNIFNSILCKLRDEGQLLLK